MDWNNDGKKDLVLGEYDGSIRIYRNRGTDEDPQFLGFVYLQQGGTKFDCGSYSTVHIVDWNNDGKKDVLCGESAGKLWLLINTGTDANPVFDDKVFVQNGGGNLTVGSRSSPTVTDWNHDGMKDLIIGEQNGTLYYFENKGSDESPIFNGFTKLKAGGSTLDVGYTSRPDVADWDEDGVIDILCGEYNGTVTYFHALGPLSLSHNQILESTGGSIDLLLNAGLSNGNRNYLILGTLSGKGPGTPLPGGYETLPLNWDAFTDLVLTLMNTSYFSNFLGTLNSMGQGTAQINAPPLPGFAGILMHFAYTLNQPFDYVSNGAAIEIVP